MDVRGIISMRVLISSTTSSFGAEGLPACLLFHDIPYSHAVLLKFVKNDQNFRKHFPKLIVRCWQRVPSTRDWIVNAASKICHSNENIML
jgi:hypothetical protein